MDANGLSSLPQPQPQPRQQQPQASTSTSTYTPSGSRACAVCSKAKVKCVFSNKNVQICQRCQRLQKVCEPATFRARPKRRPAGQDRVQMLEAKLDGLVSLVKLNQMSINGTEQASSSRSVSLDQSPGLTGSEFRPLEPLVTLVSAAAAASARDQQQLSPGATQPQIQIQIPVIPPLENATDCTPGKASDITGDENPDDLLNIFRATLSPWLPFSPIPDSMSAATLHATRPFLFLAIMTVSTRDSIRKTKLGEVLMRQLGEKVTVMGERSLDLLCGVLVYTGWTTSLFFDVPRFTMLISIATTLVSDLRIHKPPLVDSSLSFLNAIHAHTPMACAERTMEETRAYLGYFLLSSSVSRLFQRLEPPKWSSYTEECCECLDNARLAGDRQLAANIRLQNMLDKTPNAPWYTNPDPLDPATSPMPLIRSVEDQLQSLRRRFAPDIAEKAVVRMSYHHVEMALYKVGLSKATPGADELGPERLALLNSCLEAVIGFFDVFLMIPISRYPGIPFVTYAQLTHVLGTLYLLSSFNHPGWSPASITRSLNLPMVLKELSQRYNLVKKTVGLDAHTTECLDGFSRGAANFEYIVTWIEEKMAQLSTDTAEGPGSSISSRFGGNHDAGSSVDHFNDAWMPDLFVVPGHYQ